MNTKQTVKGFTIIEVVLVLAIAGLIFLMVLVALPALQKGQRDTARKNDVSIVSTAVTNYKSANKGNYPTTSALRGYISDLSSNTTYDEETEAYTGVSIQELGSASTVNVTVGNIIVVTGAKCGATGPGSGSGDALKATQTLAKGLSSQFAVVTVLEGGKGSSFCQDS